MDNRAQTLQQQTRRRRLVLFPLPFQGHINPMIQLAHILHSRGFNIIIIFTKFNCPNLANYPLFTLHTINDGISETEASQTEAVLFPNLLNERCVVPFRDLLIQLSSDDSTDPIACLITDAHFYFTQEIVDELKIPKIVLRTSSLGAFLAFAAVRQLQQKGYLPMNEDEPVLEFPPLKVKDIPTVEMQNPERSFQLIDKMIEGTKKGLGIIFNTYKELEEPELAKLGEELPIPVFPIGPFHKYLSASSSSLWTPDQASITWLDEQPPKSVIYVSFGSVAAINEEKLKEVAWGLANSEQRFLWVVRPGLVKGSEWIEILPNEFLEATSKRGYIVKWAPQQEVLSHRAVGGFWTHSGWNSTLESICEGVPMVCSPFFGDQMMDARYVNDVWKIGIKLEKGLDRVEIENAIRKLMVGKEGDDMRQNVMCLKKKLDVSLKPGGSSYQSLNDLVDFISSIDTHVCSF